MGEIGDGPRMDYTAQGRTVGLAPEDRERLPPAAYLFHVVKNHPFVDGNKRVGLASSLVVLRLNGVRIRASDDELVDLVMGVAEGKRSKADVAVFLRQRAIVAAERA